VPTREERLNTVIAWGGTGKELVKCSKSKCLKQLDRGFTQCAACDEMMPLANSALINGNVVVAHSPVGCTGMIQNFPLFMNMGRHMRGEPSGMIRVISSNLREDSAVYGGVPNLEEAILEAERRYHPPLITVITSCATGIIGDDVEAAVNKVQPQVKAPIIPIRCEGFKSGVVSSGYDAFLISLMRIIEEPKRKRADTVLIVNPFTIARPNEAEIERLLGLIGIKVQWFPLFSDVEQLKKASEAGGIATLCNLMSNLFVREMNSRYGIPFADPPMPVGLEFTAAWLREVARMFGKEAEAEKVIASEEARIKPHIKRIKSVVKGKRAYLGFNLAKALGVQSMIQELGLETAVTSGFEYSDDYGLKAFESLNKRCKNDYLVHIGNLQHFEWTNLFAKVKPDILIGGIEHCGSALREGIPVAGVLPDSFYCGYDGIVAFGRTLERALSNTAYSSNLAKRYKNPYRESWYEQDPFKYIAEGSQ